MPSTMLRRRTYSFSYWLAAGWLTLIVGLLGDSADCAPFDSIFQRCSLSDAGPKLDKCLTEQGRRMIPMFVKGIPQLGIEPMEPFDVPGAYKAKADSEVQWSFDHVKVYGLKDAVIDSIKLNYKKRKIILKLRFSPRILLNYSYKGSFLTSAVGGKADIVIVNSNLTIKLNFRVVKVNDEEHWRVSKHKVSYSPENVIHKLKADDPSLNDFTTWAINFLNTHYKEVHSQIGTPVSIMMTNKMVDEIDKVFAAVPLKDLFKP